MKIIGRARNGAVIAAVLALSAAPLAAHASITFNNLTGLNGAVFTTYTEGPDTIATTAGDAFVGDAYGNPIPDVFFGPLYGSSSTSFQLSEGGNPFTFQAFDLSANNGTTSYSILGYRGLSQVFSLASSRAIGGFGTIVNPFANVSVDRVTLDFTVGGTSANIDNLITARGGVPEPATWAMLVLGFVSLGGAVRARRRAAVA